MTLYIIGKGILQAFQWCILLVCIFHTEEVMVKNVPEGIFKISNYLSIRKRKLPVFAGRILSMWLNLIQCISIESLEQYTKNSEKSELKIQDGGHFSRWRSIWPTKVFIGTTLINFIDNMIYHWKGNLVSFPTVYLASLNLPYEKSYSQKCSGGYFQHELFVY